MAGACIIPQNRPMGRFYVMAERKLLPHDRWAFCSRAISRPTAMSSSSGSRNARGVSCRTVFTVTSSTSRCWPMTRLTSCSSASFSLKGVDILLEALAAHQAVFPGRALIVGSGPEEASLKRLARKLRLERQGVLAGPQSARSAFARAQMRGGTVARRIVPLYRAGGSRGAHAADYDGCRRHPRNRR